MTEPFRQSFVAQPGDIDELGHVNNAVWVRWVQDIAVAHWRAVAPPDQVEAYVWVVTRHEIDYHSNVGPGERVEALTYIPNPPRGARFDRCVDFLSESGRKLVAVRSTWAMLDRATGRLQRIRPEIAAPFYAP